MRIPKYEVKKGKDGQFYWHFDGGNGETQCSAEGFTREADAHRAFNGTVRNMLIYAAVHGISAPETGGAVIIPEVSDPQAAAEEITREVKKSIERDIRMRS
jgi:uncharacterized protein YegP (UPF0339 family)